MAALGDSLVIPVSVADVQTEQPRPAVSTDSASMPQQDADEKVQWSHDLCSCRKDTIKTFLKGLFCPCHLVGRHAEELGESYWTWCLADAVLRVLVADVPCVGHMAVRVKLRNKYNIEGAVWKDCCATCFCTPCALVQESQEIKKQKSGQPVTGETELTHPC